MTGLGGVTRRLRSRLSPAGPGPRRPRRPKLSVVVPVYNVESYLAECLDSVLAQPYDDVEVVLVDDGSTDGSAGIARRYADADRRFRLVSQANAGLGAARNAGVAHATGEYLTFLDSDDRLPDDAWSAMMRTLEASGSDFAIGKLLRDEGDRRYAMPRMRDNHRVRRVGVTLDEMPRILADVFSVNKVFRRSFWDAAGLSFPTGIRYEDQPTLTEAFVAADRFDVLTETVYLWRIRTDRSSITQRRDDIADLRDRLLTKRSSTESLLAKAPHLRELWLKDILPVDLWEYFRAVPGCSDEYWTLLREAVAELWSPDTVPFEETWIPVQQRLMGWYVAQDRRADLERLIAFVDENRGALPTEQRGDRVVALLPGVPGVAGADVARELPESTYTLGDHELRWEARVVAARWAEPTQGDASRLELDGFALVRHVPTGARDTSLDVRLVEAGGETVPLRAEQVRQPRATRLVGREDQDYDDCGFRCTVDLSRLPAPVAGGTSTWRLSFERRVDRLVRAGGVTGFDPAGVDRTWHDVTLAGDLPGRARLHPVDGELVLALSGS